MKVLKFGAVWCSGCLFMKPRWAEIEKENPWLKNEYYELGQDKEMFEKHNIEQNLPVFVFLDKDENEFLRLNGEVTKDKLLEILIANKNK